MNLPPRLRMIGGIGLAILSVPLGLAIGVTGTVAGAAVASSRVIGVLAGVAGLLAVTLLPRLLLPRARWLPVTLSAATLVVFAASVGVLVFVPPPGDTSPPEAGVRYWDLPTGSRIAYLHTPAQGTPRTTPVIIVHGGPGAPSNRSVLAKPLAEQGFDVYDYHQFGSGWSSRARDVTEYTVARHVADLEAIRIAIGADQVVLSGASWGGPLIANYLAAHHRRVARAIVAVPAPIWAPAFPGNTQLTPSGRSDQERVVSSHPRFLAAHILIQVAGPRTASVLMPDEQADRAYQAMVSELNMRAGCESGISRGKVWDRPPFGFWANAMTALDTQRVADPRAVLRTADTPVLVIRTECDYLAPQVAQEYLDVLPRADSVMLSGAGHELDEDRPDAYIEAVLSFVGDRAS